jgi:5'(3')-deoxyribonucleotidase
VTRIAISVDDAQVLLDLANWVDKEMFKHDSEFDELTVMVETLRNVVSRSQGKAKRK